MTDRSNPHIRSNRAVLAQAERQALEWIARRLPDAITPDLLSAFGLFSIACAGLAFASFQWTERAAAAGVVAALIANWFGDSLDGTVARVRGIERPRYGYYVDHVIDLAGTVLLFIGIAYSGLMTPLLAVVLLAAYLLVSAETYLATHATSVFRMSFFGIGPTELRLLFVAGAVKGAGGATVAIGGLGSVKLFDAGAIIAIGGLAAAFIVSAVGNARVLYLAEPVQRRADPGGPEGLHADPSPHHGQNLPSAQSDIEPAHRDSGSFQTMAKGSRQAPCPRRVSVYADRVWLNRHRGAVNRQHDTLDDHPHHA
jgi:phosphatidylglycerophosphate synthase